MSDSNQHSRAEILELAQKWVKYPTSDPFQEIARDYIDLVEQLEAVQRREQNFAAALFTICHTHDSGPWIAIYREAGGGYEGLQAIARAALNSNPASEPGAS